jgi:teichuronic acid biosynthesis glycosyltransferase TuaC
MAALRHITFVTSNYPSPEHPSRGTFVQQFVEAVAEQGIRCTVIHPWKLHEWWRERHGDTGNTYRNGKGLQVYRPLTLSLSNHGIGRFNTFTLTHASFRRAVWRVLRRLPEKPDAVYGHFLYSAGATAVWAAQRLGRPGFVAVGEGTFWTLRPLGVERARRDFTRLAGAIAVSSMLKRRLVAEVGIPEDRVAVFPNGVDLGKFHRRDRAEMRRKHGLPTDRFLVIYVGNFILPKGVQRVAEGLRDLSGVAGIFLGSGPCPPQFSNLAFRGSVAHALVPEFLSAADCFVLPSDVEGCSNATLEAMACGLPVIVSEGEFNDDIVTPKCALRVPPLAVEAIRAAIMELRDNPTRSAAMAEAALHHSQRFDIRNRARCILDWMQEKAAASSSVTQSSQSGLAAE